MSTGPAVLLGDARCIPMPNDSVDLVVTSPPYWSLRRYAPAASEGVPMGEEPGMDAYLDSLIDATAEMRRVIKPSGSIFVNLGDKYGADKSLLDIPWRYSIRCHDELGLIKRAEIIWAKANGLPESVRDRVRRSHEVFLHLTKSPRYFEAVDEIREPLAPAAGGRSARPLGTRNMTPRHTAATDTVGWKDHDVTPHPLGKLPGSVWTIATQPLRVPAELNIDHFACVDTETEVLTRRGWLRHDELIVGDEVAGYDLDRQVARWTRCSAVHRYQHDGPMVAVEKRDLSMRLTANHRTLVVRGGREQIVRADEVRSSDAIPRAAAWAPESETQCGIGATMAALCGWIAAEGWYQPTGNVHLSQSASVNADHVAAIDKLLVDAPRPSRDAGDRGITRERGRYRARLMNNGRRVTLGTYSTREEAAEALTAERERLGIDGLRRVEETRTWRGRDWVDVTWRLPRGLGEDVRRLMPDKTITAELANLPLPEARALFEAFVDGDGHRRGAGRGSPGRISIYQKYRTNLDWLQMIAVRLGYRTILTREADRFVLYCNEAHRPITLRGAGGSTAPIPREHYSGVVWCPTTGTGTMIARRRGRVFVTGQSFPMEWPRRLITGWCPREVCSACGEGRRPVTVTEGETSTERSRRLGARNHARAVPGRENRVTPSQAIDHGGSHPMVSKKRTITGYACACPDTSAPSTPGVVLDVFGGTGTTALVADVLGRVGISLDASEDYGRIARWRTTDEKERAAAAGNDRAAVVAPTAEAPSLFDLTGESA